VKAMSPARRLRVGGVLAGTLVTVLTGCATGLESLPLPARGVVTGDAFSVEAVFVNALNLPAKAKVKFNGADIGEVTAIRAHNFSAIVTMRVSSEVPLYADSTAELRSATPLGDVFIAIKPNPNQAPGTPRLHQGDTIQLGSTSAASTFEEVLSSASLLINGGLVRRLVTVVNGAGQAVGGKGAKIATLLQQTNDILSRLNARSAQLHDTLQSTSELAATLAARQDTLDQALAAAGPATSVIADNVDKISDLTDTVAGITRQLSRFPSVKGTDTRSVIADLNRLAGVANDITLDPDLSINAMNRVIPIAIHTSSSAAGPAWSNFTRIAIGNHPDKNFPGDPASHGPEGADYHNLVGSLRYEWNLLLDRIYGPQR
jgi:virulence factor Mce-like protein